MTRNRKTNDALSAAIEAISRAVRRMDHDNPVDIQAADARMFKECAAVIARATTDEVLTTIRCMRSAVQL